ncbi:hypothetical protein DL546_002861 [Coniochaeta pulveracea]|uniref:Spo12 n=1 Tax=Coniochaeta pulveracea TaxID=177199 RepID=A0A420Y2F6_9PEZI|nr:hypothetical protein DL546_002861 [Coniochaeta pulveracea]
MSNPLGAKDPNTALTGSLVQDQTAKPDIKSMEYHRQVLANKMEEGQDAKYVSPSDNIMSPCTAKLSAFRGKQIGKAKPKSLFAKASSKKLEGDALFGSTKNAPAAAE